MWYDCGIKQRRTYTSYVEHVENRTDFKLVKLPYSCKLLFQELITMNIGAKNNYKLNILILLLKYGAKIIGNLRFIKYIV